MTENYELETAKKSFSSAFNSKQKAFEKYDMAKKLTNEAYHEMQVAWDELDDAKENMNCEYDKIYEVNDYYKEVWKDYSFYREKINEKIVALRHSSDLEQAKMKECFEKSNLAYQSGDREAAKRYSLEGHDHKGCRDGINEQKKELCELIKKKKAAAEMKAPRTNNAELERAIQAFEAAKAKHKAARAKFIHLKANRCDLWKKFESAEALYNRARENYYLKRNLLYASDKEELEKESTESESPKSLKVETPFFQKVLTVLFG
ncbi:putative nuclear RNA export factor SDE5 [Candidatus Saccharibacteria bacterium]|nr:putative nuclear RNA export factor SDE5 [Candidatus Saccharibacteria bacterium]